MTDNALIVFVKNLIEGCVKTRLAATLGNEGAMDIYKQLLKNTQHTILTFATDKIVFYSDFIEEEIWGNNVFQNEIQEGTDLGERMKNAFKSSFTVGYEKIVIIGTDCPGINKSILENGFTALNNSDIVIGPTVDGGYYLLGMKKEYPFLFENIKWSTDKVLQQTIDLCNKNRLSYFLLPELSDIDEEKDLIHLQAIQNKKSKSS
jgi:rSAM/selenodomain-associated transferase 1